MKPKMCREDYLISLFLMQLLYLVGVLLMTFNLLTCVHSQGTSLTLLDKLGVRLEDFYVFIFLLIDLLDKLVFNLLECRLCGWSCKSTIVSCQYAPPTFLVRTLA